MHDAHHGMAAHIADAIERNIKPGSVLTVDGEQVAHIPFGLYDRPQEIVTTFLTTIEIGGRSWPLTSIRRYDPDNGDFVVANDDGEHVVAVRRPDIAI